MLLAPLSCTGDPEASTRLVPSTRSWPCSSTGVPAGTPPPVVVPAVVVPTPLEALAVSTAAVAVALWVVRVEFVAPPAPVVLVVLVELVVLVALVEADEAVVELLDVVVWPLVLLEAVPVLATAAVSEPAPLSVPAGVSSLLHAVTTSGIVSMKILQASEVEWEGR